LDQHINQQLAWHVLEVKGEGESPQEKMCKWGRSSAENPPEQTMMDLRSGNIFAFSLYLLTDLFSLQSYEAN
jgi:hypothetical protein